MTDKRPVLPPMPDALKESPGEDTTKAAAADSGSEAKSSGAKTFGMARASSLSKSLRERRTATTAAVIDAETKPKATQRLSTTAASAPARPHAGRSRQARLRLTHIDPWSVMKTAFLLSIALGIVWIVAVAIVWGVMGAAGVWDSINSMVGQGVGSESGGFDITNYLGTGRVLGFTMLAAVADVILLTAIATLAAFLYNLAATLLGGVEVTLTEDR